MVRAVDIRPITKRERECEMEWKLMGSAGSEADLLDTLTPGAPVARLFDVAPSSKCWGALLDARLALHALDDIADDQRTAIQDWTAAIPSWPQATTSAGQREYDLLQVRSRDVLEHIERVVRHVRRLEQNAETTVQMHFSAQGHRTNEIMRTLTALTAVFLPLNLITGFFGMNFDHLPLIHSSTGGWVALGLLVAIGLGTGAFFWRKRYLGRH